MSNQDVYCIDHCRVVIAEQAETIIRLEAEVRRLRAAVTAGREAWRSVSVRLGELACLAAVAKWDHGIPETEDTTDGG